MSLPVPVNPQLPDYLRNLLPPPNNDLASDLTGGFSVLSIRGRNFRMKYRGTETVLADQHGYPRPYLDVIIVKASPKLSKIFYSKAYQEGDDAAPHCWSADGVLPSNQVPPTQKQSTSCAACPHNVWGSKITPQGKQTKACQDSRRLAIVPSDDPINEAWGGPTLMRIPPASLQDLANYGTKLSGQGVPYQAMITRIAFDPQAAYPKLLFQPVGLINAEAAAVIANYQTDQVIDRMLENVEAGTVPEAPATPIAPVAAPLVVQPQPLPAPVVQPAPVVFPTAQGVVNPELPPHPAQSATVPPQAASGWGAPSVPPAQPAAAAAPPPAPAAAAAQPVPLTPMASAPAPAPKPRGRPRAQAAAQPAPAPAPAAAPAPAPAPAGTGDDWLDIPGFLKKTNGDAGGHVQPVAAGVMPPQQAPAPAPQPAPTAPAVAPAPADLNDKIKRLLASGG